MRRDDSRPPIWFWMVVVLISALYTAGSRVLLALLVGGNAQAALKIWVGYGLCVMSVLVLPAGIAFCRREERDTFFGMFRPPVEEAKRTAAMEEKAYQPLGLVAGQGLCLPDGAECVVRFCADRPPRAFLDYDPKREDERPGAVVSEAIHIDHDRLVWLWRNWD